MHGLKKFNRLLDKYEFKAAKKQDKEAASSLPQITYESKYRRRFTVNTTQKDLSFCFHSSEFPGYGSYWFKGVNALEAILKSI